MIAGTNSGTGKTTIATGLMAVLSKEYKVQPFKVGPDFIDPTYHSKICGRPSRNLDSFIMGESGVLETFTRASQDADFAIIEGVMGLYDGLDATEVASTAHVAKILNVPVLLVVNARGVSRSIAATVKGFLEFDKINIQGIILNNVGSERHINLIRDSLYNAGIGIPIIGALPRDQDLSIPSRHLGLYMAEENGKDISSLGALIEKHIDIESVKDIANNFTSPNTTLKYPVKNVNVRIGIAWDPAFCFYYQDSFDNLKDLGAELVFFSPMQDDLPAVDGIYLGGGYPELHAVQLEKSRTRNQIEKAAIDGMPVYGECGALLYLGKTLETDRTHNMTGILGARSKMTARLQALGYAEAEVISDSPLAKKGKVIRGHEFHYSITEYDNDARFAYKLKRGKGISAGMDGLMEYNTLASYVHTHPASVPFDEFLSQCNKYRKR